MKLRKCLALALNILLHSKLRSWLTIIGIVIGVASVVSIVSIGEGMQTSLQSRLGGLGADLITVTPGASRAESGFRGGNFGGGNEVSTKAITIRDLQAIKGVENIKSINTVITGNVEFYFLGQKSRVGISGVDPLAWVETTSSQLEIGRLLNPSDSGAVVLGNRVAKRLFKEEIGINKRISLNNKTFIVVGILKETGNGVGGGEDNRIVMHIDSARNLLLDIEKNSFSSLVIKAKDSELVDTVMTNIDAKLSIFRHTTEKTKDYTVTSAKSTQQRISDITSTMTLFLGAIAFVSLIVGAVGIANTMFTSVMEKTKEIGIMKAIGARNRDILAIFLINAGLVGLVGGLIGITFGSIISSLIPSLGLRLMGGPVGGALTTSVSPSLLIYATLLSVAIGMISGAIPSYRASKLKPVDALRYE